MIDVHQVTFGSDCEVFLRTVAGAPFPVCGLLGGTKEKPKQMEGLPPGFFIQEDNVAAEFNIPPTKSAAEFAQYVSFAIGGVKQMLPPSLVLDLENASVEFDKAYIDHIVATKRFGCEPDLNAWTMCVNPRPTPATPGFRTVSGHIHIGWCGEGQEPDMDDQLNLVRLSDVFVHLGRVMMENPSDKARRKMYGRAGSFRAKPYGVELRTLSNRWAFDYMSAKHLIQNYWGAISALNHGIKVESGDWPTIQKLINDFNGVEDAQVAAEIIKKYEQKCAEKAGGLVFWRGEVKHLAHMH